VLAGVIAGVILGTAHALVMHVAGGPAVTTAIVRVPVRPAIPDNDRPE